MPIIKITDFSLKHTLECGQFFRYVKEGEFYFVQSRDKLFKIRQVGDTLEFKGNITPEFITYFFRLDEDFSNIKRKICVDKHVRIAMQKYPGLRLIRQDPWECIISYVCSSASNIPKIQKNIRLLAEKQGQKVELERFASYTFPEPGSLDKLKTINACKVGYRDKYICEINRVINEQYLDKLGKLNYIEAKVELKKLPGVGDKVADCVLLFSLNHLEAFPIDTWVKKVMERLYFNGKSVSNRTIREFAAHYFGKYAGYAQEYLFYFERMNSKETRR